MTNTTTVGAVWTRLAERERAGNDSALIDARYAPCYLPTNRNEIIFDSHVTGECVIIFDENATRVIQDALIEWFG